MNPTLIVLTGAASGIGKQLLATFSARQIPMILVDLAAGKLETLAQDSKSIAWVDGDVAQEETWLRVMKKAQEMELPISHLINCAGVIRPGFLEGYGLEDIDYHLNCNAKGTILGTTLIGREMKNQGFGHILNISSLAGLAPVSGLSLYAASKFALRGMTECWRAELRKHNIRVVLLNPSEVATAFFSNDRSEREEQPSKLRSLDIALAAKHCLEMDDRAFIPEISVWATNPIS